MIKYKIKCECPIKGFVPKSRYNEYSEEEQSIMNHEPNKCPCRAGLSLYKRNEKNIWLCSCCVIFDKFIRKATEEELKEKSDET